jgi:hypothetical protein
MKKLIIPVFASFLMVFALTAMTPQVAQAQMNEKVTSFIDKYSGNEGFTTVRISPQLFQMFAAMSIEADDPDAQEIIAMVELIEGLEILIYEGEGNASAPALYKEANNLIPGNGYFTELMTVQSDNENVRFLVKEKKTGIIQELLMVVTDSEEFVFLSLRGEIDLAKVAKLAQSMDIDGFEHLQDLKDEID